MTQANAATTTGTNVFKRPKSVAGTIITGHGFQHMYADGFLVLLPLIKDAFGVGAVELGVLSTARQAAGGLLSMGGGFLVDMFSGKRALLLATSLFSMGLAYLLAGLAPNFWILVLGVGLGSAAGSFWHPVGLGILSYTFPNNRALMMSLHRSAGSFGETFTPFLVAGALIFVSWRGVLVGGFFLIALVAACLLVILLKIGVPEREHQARSTGEQVRSIGGLFKDRALPLLLLVTGLRGMADRSMIFFLPVLIAQLLREVDPGVSDVRIATVVAFHLALMTGTSVVVSPFIGAFSDRVGRKPILVTVLAFSALISILLGLTSTIGVAFAVLVGALGLVRFAGANMAQAASLDIAEGKRLEGSMIGLLWGNNALFGSLSPILLGFVIATFSPAGTEDYSLIFPYAAVFAIAATVASVFLPPIGKPNARKV
ncbi:MAG: MFS transporter [Dehalococcoidia bacterium]|nr:MFS transporter [Dehalococcoidia bacterium]